MRYILIIFFCFFINSSFCQTMTTYEKNIYSLTVKFLRKLGVDESILKKSNQIGDLEKIIVAGNFMKKLNTESGILLLLEYEREMKEAEKLKTAIDFQREKIRKEEDELRKQKEIIKQKEIQKQENLKNIANEKREHYNSSDYVRILNSIKNNVNVWLQKDEFEKTDKYKFRILNNISSAFDSICFKILSDAFEEKTGFSSNLLKYNADSEKFGIEFNFNDVIFSDSINIPLKSASEFENEFENFGIYVDLNDWGFMNNNLTPTKIIFFNKDIEESFQFYFTNKEIKSITFLASEINLDLKNIISNFNLNEFYYKRMFEIKDGSAINSLAWDCLLRQNFTKALHILEQGIPLINMNDETYAYLQTNLAHAYLFNDQFEKAHKIYFENTNLKVNNKSWGSVIINDFEIFKEKGITSVDMEKIYKEFLELGYVYQNEDEEILFKVENESEFPGGPAAWTRHLLKSLEGFDPAKNGAPPNIYKVIVKFIVRKDGSISNIEAETHYGYGMEEQAIKCIKNGPKWRPALQNGRNVNAYRRQPIIFKIEE